MSYVDRNANGEIIAVYANKQRDGQEFIEGAALPVPTPVVVDPVIKLRDFLVANPDVAALLK